MNTHEMILVTKVEVQYCPGTSTTIFTNHLPPRITEEYREDDFCFDTETVYGRRFRNERGEEVVLGMTKDVQETIGLAFYAFSNLEQSYKIQREQRIKYEEQTINLRKELSNMKNMSFWERLRFVFQPIKFLENQES